MSGQHRHATTTTIVIQPADSRDGGFQANLVGLSGSVFGNRYLLGQDTVVIGRDPEVCDIVVDDSGVSRVHARIVRDARGHRLLDCGSKNGTLLDDSHVSEVVLRDGQQIRIGKSVFKYLRLNAVELHYHDRMERLSQTDDLTGIPNRRHAWDVLQREISRSLRHGHAVSVVMFDIDHFKVINDTHGHAAGDACLVGVTRRVAQLIRQEDVFARIGGEEFLVVLPETDIVEAAEAATRIRDHVAAEPIDVDGTDIRVTVSLGVSDLDELRASVSSRVLANPSGAVDAIFSLADAKLYEAKHLGRNRVAV